MLLDKISKEIVEQVRFRPYYRQSQEWAAEYVKDKYPGNYKVTVAEDMVISITFDTNEDMTLFLLKYS